MEFSSQVYTCPIIIIFVLTGVWRILNRKKQTATRWWERSHAVSLVNQSAHTRWCSVVRVLVSPCIESVHLWGSIFQAEWGSAGKTLSDLPAVVLTFHLRTPTQEDKIPNSIHYDGGILVPENSIVACYHGTRHQHLLTLLLFFTRAIPKGSA